MRLTIIRIGGGYRWRRLLLVDRVLPPEVVLLGSDLVVVLRGGLAVQRVVLGGGDLAGQTGGLLGLPAGRSVGCNSLHRLASGRACPAGLAPAGTAVVVGPEQRSF